MGGKAKPTKHTAAERIARLLTAASHAGAAPVRACSRSKCPPGAGGRLEITTNHGTLTADLDDLGLADVVLDAGGLGRQVRAFRLPLETPHREVSFTTRVALTAPGDNPLWVCVTTEDGFQAWSSPIYAFNGAAAR